MADTMTGYRTRPVSLSRRLQTISELAGAGSVVCDVGCDHAHIPIRLLQEKRFLRAIGMDVIGGPLEKAAGNLRLYGMESRVELRLSDGLDAFRAGEADTLIIAGMGGSMIREILLREPAKTRSFEAMVLGPQSDPDQVRRCLRALGFPIEEERLLYEDGKYYPILRAVRRRPDSAGGQPAPFPEADLWKEEIPEEIRRAAEDLFGPVLLRRRDPVLQEFLRRRTAVLEKILRSVRKAVVQSAPRGQGGQDPRKRVPHKADREENEEKELQDAAAPRQSRQESLYRTHLARQKEIERDLAVFRAALTVYESFESSFIPAGEAPASTGQADAHAGPGKRE